MHVSKSKNSMTSSRYIEHYVSSVGGTMAHDTALMAELMWSVQWSATELLGPPLIFFYSFNNLI